MRFGKYRLFGYWLRFFRSIQWFTARQVVFLVLHRVWLRKPPNYRSPEMAATLHTQYFEECGMYRIATQSDALTLERLSAVLDTEVSVSHLTDLQVYELHYLSCLSVKPHAHALIDRLGWYWRWRAVFPPYTAVAWDPYPVSRRLLNLTMTKEQPGEGVGALAAELEIHARLIHRRLERHLGANHLLVNFCALVVAGKILKSGLAPTFLEVGLHGLEREVKKQILPDGVHYERSLFYHRLLLWDLLYVCYWLRDEIGAGELGWLVAAVEIMMKAAVLVSHVDGTIPLFNDASIESSPTLVELQDAYKNVMGSRPIYSSTSYQEWLAFEEAGFVRMGSPDATFSILVNLGFCAPSHNPAHYHADIGSYEVVLKQGRLITNLGTYTYQAGPERTFYRGTKSKNNLVINSKNSSDVWGAFRVGKRAEVDAQLSGSKISIKHSGFDGYLKDGFLTSRQIQFSDRVLGIVDRFNGKEPGDVISWIHFGPCVMVESLGENRFLLRLENSQSLLTVSRCLEATMVSNMFSADFGCQQLTTSLQISAVTTSSGVREVAYDIKLDHTRA